MLVSKIGDELAVRLTAEDAARLGLKEGDEVIVLASRPDDPIARLPDADGSYPPLITDAAERAAAIEELRRFRGMMPADFKFDREQANER